MVGSFTMKDNATVSGNTSSGDGGGVYVNNGGTFPLVGGTVYGDVGKPMGNTCSSNNGAALYKYPSSDAVANYGNGSNILPHTDGFAYYTNDTIKR